MHNNMPRLRDAQSGSGELHSAQTSFPGISLRTTETGSALLPIRSITKVPRLLGDLTLEKARQA